MTYNLEEFGNRLATIRANKGLTQKEISIMLGISQSLYSKIETGKYDVPLSVLFDLSRIYEVSISWIIGEQDRKFSNAELLEIEHFKEYLISKRK